MCLCVCVWYVTSSVLLSVQEGGINLVIRHRNGRCGRLPRLCRLDCGYVRQKHCHQLGRRPHSDGSQVRKEDDTFLLWCLRWTSEKGCTVLFQHFRSQLELKEGWLLLRDWQPWSGFAELGQCVILQGSHGLWRSLKVWREKYGICFSRPWKSGKTEWGLWKFVNFVVFRVLGKNCQLISQKLHLPRLSSCFKKQKLLCEITTHFLSVLTDRVCWPTATVRVASLYQMCRSVAYLRVAFPCHIAKVWKVCEFWKDFSVRTL